MAAVHGKRARVLVDQFDLSQYLQDIGSQTAIDQAECSGLGTDDKKYVVGLRGSVFPFSGVFYGAANEIDAILSAALGNDVGHVLTYAPVGWATGNPAKIAESKATQYDVNSSITDKVSVGGSFIAADGAVHGKVLKPHVAVAAPENGTSVDNAAATTNGLVAHVHLTAFTGTNATVKVQHSVDNSVWVDLITFTVATGVTKERVTVAGTVNRYLRSTLAGTFTNVEYAVAAARR